MIGIVYTWDNTGIDKLENSLAQGVQFSKIVLLNGEEWEYTATVAGRKQGVNTLLSLAKQQNIVIDIVTGSAKESPVLFKLKLFKKFKLHYWETFWLSHTYNIQQDNLKQQTVEDYNFHIVSLNNRPHTHRCLMIDIMSKYNLIDNNAISWHEAKYDSEDFKDTLTSLARGYKYKYWAPKVLTLDSQYVTNGNQNLLPKEYWTSFCQLVIESTIDVTFITEKTSMPLFYMKPFIVASSKGYHRVLERMGFKLYTELFDYSFDSIGNTTKRFNAVAKNLARINSLPKDELKTLYNKILDKLEYNKQHAIMLATKLEQQPDILKDIYKQTVGSDFEFDKRFNNIFLQYS
jgi:hypothetical protein